MYTKLLAMPAPSINCQMRNKSFTNVTDNGFASDGNKKQKELEMDSEHLQNRDSGDDLHIDNLGGLSQLDQIDELNAILDSQEGEYEEEFVLLPDLLDYDNDRNDGSCYELLHARAPLVAEIPLFFEKLDDIVHQLECIAARIWLVPLPRYPVENPMMGFQSQHQSQPIPNFRYPQQATAAVNCSVMQGFGHPQPQEIQSSKNQRKRQRRCLVPGCPSPLQCPGSSCRDNCIGRTGGDPRRCRKRTKRQCQICLKNGGMEPGTCPGRWRNEEC
jgi:hypothetical protein